MEGKQRALQAYQTSTVVRLLAENLCCMGSLFTKRKLLQKGYLNLEDTVDPSSIIWENLGTSGFENGLRWAFALVLAAFIFCMSFAGLWWAASVEKMRAQFVKSDCNVLPFYSQHEAYTDFRENNQRLGLMHCYCQ